MIRTATSRGWNVSDQSGHYKLRISAASEFFRPALLFSLRLPDSVMRSQGVIIVAQRKLFGTRTRGSMAGHRMAGHRGQNKISGYQWRYLDIAIDIQISGDIFNWYQDISIDIQISYFGRDGPPYGRIPMTGIIFDRLLVRIFPNFQTSPELLSPPSTSVSYHMTRDDLL